MFAAVFVVHFGGQAAWRWYDWSLTLFRAWAAFARTILCIDCPSTHREGGDVSSSAFPSEVRDTSAIMPWEEVSMTHRVRNVLGRFVGFCIASAIVLFASAGPAAAQQTSGKVEGTVTDQAGGPLANAQVIVVGTSFGSVTDAKGYYFINNLPVGTYTLRAQFIGYAPNEVQGVRILGGQTIT